MPITPFHFGAGLLFRGVSRHVSLSAFIIANCLIDIEPIATFLLTGDPMHRFMHTYLGATLAGVVTALFAKRPAEQLIAFWNSRLSPQQAHWLRCSESIPTHSIWIGAFLGAWSHIWLDAFMHVDVEPWWPFETGNAAHGTLDMTLLHELLVIAGVMGLLLIGSRRWRVKPVTDTQDATSSMNEWTKSARLGLVVAGVWAFESWAMITPSMYSIGALLSMLMLFSGIFFLYLPVAAIASFFQPIRKTSQYHLKLFLGFIVGILVGTAVGNPIRMNAYRELGERSEPLIRAIHRFEDEHGSPPPTLEVLVPDYLPAIPEAVVGGSEPYHYRAGGSGYDQWSLRVHASSGMGSFDEFIYLPNQDYEKHFASRTVLGKWVYIRS